MNKFCQFYCRYPKLVTDEVMTAEELFAVICSACPNHKDSPEVTAPEEPAPKKKKEPKRVPIDMGKIGALRDGGWSIAKIADEMGCSQATVYSVIKKLREKKEAEKE